MLRKRLSGQLNRGMSGVTLGGFVVRGFVVRGLVVIGVCLWGAGVGQASSDLGPSDVLILVNGNSPVSQLVADLYLDRYPTITSEQVLVLSGLPDSASATAGPANEIITRDNFQALIAQPTRDYLIATGLVNDVYCIITTAGMPYRIEDTDPALADVVKPAGSDAWLTVNNRSKVNAASVESELAVLFQIDPAIQTSAKLPIKGRVINPYQGYSSGIKSWSEIRYILGRRTAFRWTYLWLITKSPNIEGVFDSSGFSAYDRWMSPADIYLVARLDGPRAQGGYPIFAVMDMLKRSAWVSDPSYRRFVGYNGALAAAVIDEDPDAPDELAYSATFNFPPQYDMLDFAGHPVPPGAEEFSGSFNESNHFAQAFRFLTGQEPLEGGTQTENIAVGLGGSVLWDDTNAFLDKTYLAPNAGLIGLLTYGKNSGAGSLPSDYLLKGGPGNGPLFACLPGAVFVSMESFNAVTMFTSVSTSQGKIAEFIEMGGTAAIGHAFEPEAWALIQGEFLLRNLLRDENGDGIGDLTLVEAAASATPYLSWSEVLIGDPLMRLRSGPGGFVGEPVGDINGDGRVLYSDSLGLWVAYNSCIGDGTGRYNPAADLNEDGCVGYLDYLRLYQALQQ